MSPGELPYPPQQSHQGQPSQQPQWSSAPHLLPPAHAPPAFAGNPSNSAPPLGDQQQQQQQQQHFPNYYQQGPAGGQAGLPDSAMLDRPTTLSLNLSSLSIASPTNLSPINQSPHTSTATSGVSPITPISPSNPNIQGPSPFGAHHHPSSHPPGAYSQHAPPPSQPQFSFAPPDQGQGIRCEDLHYDLSARRMGLSSRSSSSSEKSVPRKRSITAGPLPTNIEEASMFDRTGGGNGANGAMQLDGPGDGYDEVDMTYSSVDPNGSPIDDSTSGGEQDDQLKPLINAPMASGQQGPHSVASQASGMNVIGKPIRARLGASTAPVTAPLPTAARRFARRRGSRGRGSTPGRRVSLPPLAVSQGAEDLAGAAPRLDSARHDVPPHRRWPSRKAQKISRQPAVQLGASTVRRPCVTTSLPAAVCGLARCRRSPANQQGDLWPQHSQGRHVAASTVTCEPPLHRADNPLETPGTRPSQCSSSKEPRELRGPLPCRMFLVAAILASKFLQDKCNWNCTWVELAGDLRARHLGPVRPRRRSSLRE
ncbi:hypothetical protein DENSPDRAFT_877049 [Dentipellis sp. KUC8613]|nr:hypothetical protein DENSPDRAFT_877049 [Dentipellis sp. KUC8613]